MIPSDLKFYSQGSNAERYWCSNWAGAVLSYEIYIVYISYCINLALYATGVFVNHSALTGAVDISLMCLIQTSLNAAFINTPFFHGDYENIE